MTGKAATPIEFVGDSSSLIQEGDLLLLAQLILNYDNTPSTPPLQTGFTSLFTDAYGTYSYGGESDGGTVTSASVGCSHRMSWKIAEAIDIGKSYTNLKKLMILRTRSGDPLTLAAYDTTVMAAPNTRARPVMFGYMASRRTTFADAPMIPGVDITENWNDGGMHSVSAGGVPPTVASAYWAQRITLWRGDYGSNESISPSDGTFQYRRWLQIYGS